MRGERVEEEDRRAAGEAEHVLPLERLQPPRGDRDDVVVAGHAEEQSVADRDPGAGRDGEAPGGPRPVAPAQPSGVRRARVARELVAVPAGKVERVVHEHGSDRVLEQAAALGPTPELDGRPALRRPDPDAAPEPFRARAAADELRAGARGEELEREVGGEGALGSVAEPDPEERGGVHPFAVPGTQRARRADALGDPAVVEGRRELRAEFEDARPARRRLLAGRGRRQQGQDRRSHERRERRGRRAEAHHATGHGGSRPARRLGRPRQVEAATSSTTRSSSSGRL